MPRVPPVMKARFPSSKRLMLFCENVRQASACRNPASPAICAGHVKLKFAGYLNEGIKTRSVRDSQERGVRMPPGMLYARGVSTGVCERPEQESSRLFSHRLAIRSLFRNQRNDLFNNF